MVLLQEYARAAGTPHGNAACKGGGDLQIDRILVGAIPDGVLHATQSAFGSIHADVLAVLVVVGTTAGSVLGSHCLSEQA